MILIQIVIAIILTAVILLQPHGSGAGSSWGGLGGSYRTKQGAEKVLFWLTVVLTALFVGLGIINLL